MPSKPSRILRASALALVATALTPAASAVGQGSGYPDAAPVPAAATLAALRAASHTATPGTIGIWAQGGATALIGVEQARVAALAMEAEAVELSPGSFIWQPEVAAHGETEMVVSIAAQRAWVFRGGKLIGISTVSTGREGHRTPTGAFPLLQKKKMHFSTLYDSAPMPHMQRLTWDGVALHAGAIPGYPASHGCIRLPSEFARLLYGVTTMGTVVRVIADHPPEGLAALHYAWGEEAPAGAPAQSG